MATKLAPAQKRLYTDVFVCKRCSHKMRTQSVRVLANKVSCRKCNCRDFRQIKKK